MRFSPLTALLAITLAAFALTGCNNDVGRPAGDVELELSETASSNQSGTAALITKGKQTLVILKVDGDSVSESQPAHIHEGTCNQLSPEPAFKLQNVADDRSATTVDVPLDSLTSGTYAIDLHASDEDVETHTTCGNIEP